MKDPNTDLLDPGIDLPDDEDLFLEEMGMGPDGSAMMLSDQAWTGEAWEPDVEQGVW